MHITSFDAPLMRGKKVLVRVDFNVPFDGNGDIADDSRMRAHVPTIKKLLDAGAHVALISHRGRPKGKVNQAFSLKPLEKHLETLLAHNVSFCSDCVGQKVEEALENFRENKVILLENARFHPEEEANDPGFAQKLAAPFDCFVMDAFSAAHRAHASTAGIIPYLPSYAGLLLMREFDFLSKVRDCPEAPFFLILGGAKVSDKIGVIEHLMEKTEAILIGGGMAFTFLAAQGHCIGASLCEEGKIPYVKELLKKAEEQNVQILLPRDVLVASSPEAEEFETVCVQDIPENVMGLDIGPETTQLFSRKIKEASTILWNGPMGVFENPSFAQGTLGVATALKDVTQTKGAVTVVGGGDSASAIHHFNLSSGVTHVSTGGGASLEFFEGKNLPGIAPFLVE